MTKIAKTWFGNEDGVRKSFQLLGAAVQFRTELRVELGVKLKKFSSTFAPEASGSTTTVALCSSTVIEWSHFRQTVFILSYHDQTVV